MIKNAIRILLLALVAIAAPAMAQEDGWQKGGAYDKKFDPKSIVTIKGTVTKIDRDVHPLADMEPGFAADIKTAKGETFTVQVGPVWFTSYFKKKWDAKVGDQVQVTGSKVTINGKPVIMAMEGSKGNVKMVCRSKTGKPVWDLDIVDF